MLADLARGLLRKKIPALREALQGRFDVEHSLIVSQILAHIDFLDESIGRLSNEIEARIEPFAAQRDLLMSIPGLPAAHRRGADLRSEIGVDMTVFATPKHLASWAKMSPGNNEPAGKRRSGKTSKANKWLRATLTEAALSAGKTQKLLPRRSIPTPARPPRTQQSRHRRRTLHPDRHLAHAHQRRALQRPRQRLLHPPQPRPHHQTPHDNSKRSGTTSPSNPESSPPDKDFATAGLLVAALARGRATWAIPDVVWSADDDGTATLVVGRRRWEVGRICVARGDPRRL